MLVRMPQDKQSAALKLRTWAALVVETGGCCAPLCVCGPATGTGAARLSTSCAGPLSPSSEATVWHESSGLGNLRKLCGRAWCTLGSSTVSRSLLVLPVS